MEQYTETVMKHFQHPKNMGEMKSPDAVGTVGNPVCGDVMKIYIKVKANKIVDIKFETYGCVAAIANSSALTVLAKGKTLEDAEKLTNADVIKELGGTVPPVKLHCSMLAIEGLKAAIKDYKSKHKQK